MNSSSFRYTEDNERRLQTLVHPNDSYEMNWVDGMTPWGTIKQPQWPEEYASWGVPRTPYRLDVEVVRELTAQGRLRERYIFQNNADYEIHTLSGELGIYTPFNDNYESAQVSKTQRCHTHIWCGGESSCIMALRMGGEAPHLGMMLIKGAIDGYEVERDTRLGSNDRGDIILHCAPICLKPGERTELVWELFWFETREEFFRILRSYPNYIEIQSEQYMLFEGEDIILRSNAEPSEIRECASIPGERRYEFRNAHACSHADILIQPRFDELLRARVRFIMERQQCLDASSRLYGAYLIYDNEENCQYYSHNHDHNAGRERVAMGVLIARYLQTHSDGVLRQSLKLYLDYVLRELFDSETGQVFNDCARSADWHRTYNYMWMVQLFCESWRLFRDKLYLQYAARAVLRFYLSDGGRTYPIGLDVAALCEALEAEDMQEEASAIREQFARHAEFVLEQGTNYPAHEVNFEQSIVQPALNIMLQAYSLFGSPAYLQAAREHLKLLELFSGFQPNYHLNEVAIRHWDGFWFGKKRLWGDTFPHYWSALSGDAFALFARVTGELAYEKRAERALRAPLSMFMPDGSASCAFIFPRTVNGQSAHCWDPWANDQDWAMYYYLKWHDEC